MHPTRFLCLTYRLWFLAVVVGAMGAFLFRAAAANEATEAPGRIQELNLVHFSHTDVGFTDHPAVCRELYRRYLDIAVDAILDSRKGPKESWFYWTAEATMPVNDWWQAAPVARRRQFLRAVRLGQLEITALPFNNTPFLNAAQWETALYWLPDDLWQEIRPQVAIQNDVNGMPRAAAIGLLNRGVRFLFTGINEDSGGVPFPRPSAFWWKMPDGRRLFVWLNIGYGSGFDFFEPQEWRRGPVPRAADAAFRPPRRGDMLSLDETQVRAAHRRCQERLLRLEKSGYAHPVLTLSITSQWRFDNDPPFPPLAEFVAAWNRLQLQPRLRLTTVTDAMQRMQQAMGPTAPEYAGEWTDWWANGTASAPREVAASRIAKRYLAAAAAPLWGKLTPPARQTMNELYRELCLFDEHTWGSSLSVAKPYSLDTQAQFNEKARLAFRPMAQAEWLLSQRARSKFIAEGEGLYLANPSPAAFSGWVRFIATSLRQPAQSMEDPITGERRPLFFEPGVRWGRPGQPSDLSREDISATFPDLVPQQIAKFWVDNLPANSVRRLQLSDQPAKTQPPPPPPGCTMQTNPSGWPSEITWPGMTKPLFLEGFGGFAATTVKGFAPRWALADIRAAQGQARDRLRREKLAQIDATMDGPATVQETPYTYVFTQPLRHPRLQWATRVVEVWKHSPRVRFILRLNRISSADPEIFYAVFPLPTGEVLPQVSSGGQTYTPFTDQLPGTCRDYFAVDGWVDYRTPQGRWLWVSRDVPLISFGSDPTLALRQEPPPDHHRLMAMLLNNFWYTNFAADSHGIMEFQFDLIWQAQPQGAASDLADALTADPVVVINPALPEDARVVHRLYQP